MSCPICNKPSDPNYKPFCSKRCADIDLGKWLDGAYVISGSDEEDQASADVIDFEQEKAKREG